MNTPTHAEKPYIAASYFGVAVPRSGFLTPKRIERLNDGTYEGAEIAGALSVVTPSDRVLELGAGIGVVGAAIALNCAPQRIVSYEANSELVPVIEALYQYNRLGRIQVRNRVVLAGPDAPHMMPFYLNSSYLGSSLADKKTRKTQAVQVGTDLWAAVQQELAPTVIVMDIEGGELEFLRHADLTGVRAMVIEFHPSVYEVAGLQEAKSILRRQGFKKHDDTSVRTVWTCSRSV